jgi:hypothetical protein
MDIGCGVGGDDLDGGLFNSCSGNTSARTATTGGSGAIKDGVGDTAS